MNSSGVFDYDEVAKFESNLESELDSIMQDFSKPQGYKNRSIREISYQKDKDKSNKRTIYVVSLRDQVAWATVMLALGEWFDTQDRVLNQDNLLWMKSWSCNNRIRRKFYPDRNDHDFKRLFINLWSKDIYESFQWGLRQWREHQRDHFEKVFESLDKEEKNQKGENRAYYGTTDIKDFYPTLKMQHILDVIEARLRQLTVNGLNIDQQAWLQLIRNMSNFEIVGKTREGISNQNLPTGLIADGFLANIVLTEKVDIELEKFSKSQDRKVFFSRYTDDFFIVAASSELVVTAIEEIERLLKGINLKINKEKTFPGSDFKGVLDNCLDDLKECYDSTKKEDDGDTVLEV